MKKIIFLLTVICSLFIFENTFAQVYEPINTPKIKDGEYKAIVKYNNFSTNAMSTYELLITIKSERVIALHFPNEGSIHSGQNNSGYSYSGGALIKNLKYDRSGAIFIDSATTSIQVRYKNGSTVSFTVLI
ncbi:MULTISPECIES: hypothetical protein [Sphingobacterium]|uniref:hypothetical protein n=1 Tax=Sphingobacterium TaxID=28453 RepID=UPI001043022E|nr:MULTISPECIES: hypothetical protein [Sphingobacterium]MCW2258671.1 hypothetical protein [Sphingobacterium kitahiroshimense]TCR14873.1 hypothetical protein EDF67_101980 [Sphingobacterium sp. JUb78]